MEYMAKNFYLPRDWDAEALDKKHQLLRVQFN